MAKNKKSRVSKESKSPKKLSSKETNTQAKGTGTEEKQPAVNNESSKKNLQENNEQQPLETEDIPASSIAHNDEIHEAPPDTNCKCMQKKPAGKYFCFKLQQGRWVQSSAIPFDTQEFCEEICC